MTTILACFGAGCALAMLLPRARRLGPLLDRLVLFVAVPALVLLRLPELPVGRTLVAPVVVAVAAIATAVPLVLLVARRRSWERRTTGALLLVTPLGNTGYFGLPMVAAVLGASQLGTAIVYDQVGGLCLATYGSVIASRFGEGGPDWRATWHRLRRYPPFVAVLVSIPLRWFPLPAGANGVLHIGALLVAPLAMLALGLRFEHRLQPSLRLPAAWAIGLKMVAVPILLVAATRLLGLGGAALHTSIVQSGMPPMATAAILSSQAGLEDELATFVVGAGMLLGLLTVPLTAHLLG